MRIFLCIFLTLALLPCVRANTRFLTISDIHYSNDNVAGEGHDTDDALLSLTFHKFKQLVKKVDFILTLGDFPAHMLINSPKKEAYIKTVFHGLYKADINNKPMFYITGNNDSLAGNYQPFSSKGRTPLTLATDWHGACVHCAGLLIDETQMLTQGYYSSYVMPNNKNILLIALNSVQFANLPFYRPQYPYQNQDAFQQLNWLEKQLKTHHAKQLLIAMHVPPGIDYQGNPLWKDEYLDRFIKILNKTYHQYGEINLLSSHTHMDDVRKITLANGCNIYAYATPSISPAHYTHPAMKIFKLNQEVKFMDSTTYYTSNYKTWENKHYHAIQGTQSIFPQCHQKTLHACLESMSLVSLCHSYNKGNFYGVKNLHIDNPACDKTYLVNFKH